MSGVIISSGFVVSSGIEDLTEDNPIIGYDNLVDSSNVVATTEASGFPATNISNPSTYLRWQSTETDAEEFITITLDTEDEVDYLAIARHNFGSNQNPVSIEGQATDGGAWTEIIEDHLLGDDGPVIFRFTSQSLFAIRIRIQASNLVAPVEPFLAVAYVGQILVLERRVYVGHTPVTMGRTLMVANHMSISGNFLGRVVLGRKLATSVELTNLTASWYREYFEPFAIAAQEIPFFFSWRPGTYPLEVGYAWLTKDVKPSNTLANGMMSVGIDLEAIG